MSAASKTPADTTENNSQRDAEEAARMAESVHKKVAKFDARVALLGRQQLDAAIEAGHHLIKAKEILGHGNFKKEQDRWRNNGTTTFSDRSGRRYMQLAAYAEELKMANVANLREAERYVAGLEANEKKAGNSKVDVSTSSGTKSTDHVAQCETRVLNDMRRLEPDEQRSFLEAFITRLSERLQHLNQ